MPKRAAPAPAANENPAAPVGESATPKPLCDVAACAAAYRSFRESDCTFNPSVGPRQLCTKGVAPIQAAPFYAIPIYPGDLGTNGGLKIDTHGRVITESGKVIPGLFAAGNTSASIMGRSYPGAGGTIGPAMCFGFLGAEQAAAEPLHATVGDAACML